MTELEILKERVAKYGRKKMTKALAWPYQKLSHKLGEFSPLFEEEKKAIEKILKGK